jgi:hypothetical protein
MTSWPAALPAKVIIQQRKKRCINILVYAYERIKTIRREW